MSVVSANGCGWPILRKHCPLDDDDCELRLGQCDLALRNSLHCLSLISQACCAARN